MCQDHYDAAVRWRDADSKKECDRIFMETGVRWSELLCLPYWDPTRFLIIDSMHNLFLGLTWFHFRDLIVIDKQENKNICRSQISLPKPVDAEELDKGRAILKTSSMQTALSRLRLPTLLALLEECNGLGMLSSQKKPTKAKVIKGLMVSEIDLPSGCIKPNESLYPRGRSEKILQWRWM